MFTFYTVVLPSRGVTAISRKKREPEGNFELRKNVIYTQHRLKTVITCLVILGSQKNKSVRSTHWLNVEDDTKNAKIGCFPN
jgi:hypothetical protein